jgi:hypothetical protein
MRILSDVLGRPLALEHQSDTEARIELGKLFPPDFDDAMFRFYADSELDDSRILPTVLELTGRLPRNFSEWARAHAATFDGAPRSA